MSRCARSGLGLCLFTQGDRPVGFEGDDEVLVEALTDKGEIVLGRKPAIGQDIAVEESILLADPQHLPQQLVFRYLAFVLDLARLHIAKQDRFAD